MRTDAWRSPAARVQNFLTYRIAATLQLIFFFFIALYAFPPRDYEPEAKKTGPEEVREHASLLERGACGCGLRV
jgi:H+-transporting ATPase